MARVVQDVPGRMGSDVRAASSALLRPGSVAIIGASEDPSLPGGRLLHSLVQGRFPGPVYPVTEPREDGRKPPSQLYAHRAFASLSELPGRVDLAVIALPPERAAATVGDLVRKGVRAIIVPVPGFAEAHQQGREHQRRMVETARSGGARLLGPNTLGIYSHSARLDLTWRIDPTPIGASATSRRPPRVALLSQAGELDQVFISSLAEHGESLALYASLGNAADVGFEHLLLGATEEPGVRAVAMVPTGEMDLPAVASAVRQVSEDVPVLLAPKVRGRAARRAARSHVGGATEASEAMPDLEAAGAIAARDLEDLSDKVAAVVSQPMARGPRVAVVSTSGGAAVAVASHLHDLGLEVPHLPADVQHTLRFWLPEHAGASNPVNLTTVLPPPNYRPVVSGVMGQSCVDGAIVLAVGDDPPALGRAVLEAADRRGKPVVAVTVGASRTRDTLMDAGIPVYPTPSRAARAYSALVPGTTYYKSS